MHKVIKLIGYMICKEIFVFFFKICKIFASMGELPISVVNMTLKNLLILKEKKKVWILFLWRVWINWSLEYLINKKNT